MKIRSSYSLLLVMLVQACICKGQKRCDTKIDSLSGLSIVEKYDTPSSYPNGISALNKFVYSKYNDDKNEPFQGSFTIVCVIKRDGTPVQFRIDGKDSNSYTEGEKEMLRVFRQMPKWIPAKCDGKNVSSLIKIPIQF